MDIVMRIAGGLVILLVVYMAINEIYKTICKRKESKGKYKVILEDLYNKLKSRSAEDILNKNDFKLDKKYYNAIKPGKYITELVEEMASEILAHIGIKENVDVVVLYDDVDRFNSTKEKAGYYRSNTKNRDIHIVVKKDYSCSDVAAILCHEISHLYMEIINIVFADKSKNEEATDIIAIMLGFGKILIDGYYEHQYEEEIGIGLTKIHKSKIGYISSSDCKIVYTLVKELRNIS